MNALLPHAVTFFALSPDRKVLGISRGKDLTNWGLPGGKVEEGESLRRAMARELWEETGIVVTLQKLEPLFCRAVNNYFCTTFTAPFVGFPDEFRETEEGTVRWLSPEDFLIESCSFREYNRILFTNLGLL